MSDCAKAAIRKQIRAVLSTEPLCASAPITAFRQLCETEAFRSAPAVVAYCAFQKELSVDLLIGEALVCHKELYLPRFQNSEYRLCQILDPVGQLTPGNYGIPEPTSGLPAAESLPDGALWLVPGLAFDPLGHRLGRGKGYYDRLMARYPHKTVIGCCRECQFLPIVPANDEWDIPMDGVLTENDFYYPLFENHPHA